MVVGRTGSDDPVVGGSHGSRLGDVPLDERRESTL